MEVTDQKLGEVIFAPVLAYLKEHDKGYGPFAHWDWSKQLISDVYKMGFKAFSFAIPYDSDHILTLFIRYNAILEVKTGQLFEKDISNKKKVLIYKIGAVEKEYYFFHPEDIGVEASKKTNWQDYRFDANAMNKPMPPTTGPNASVVGRAVVGSMLGGTAGAVIGAASAMQVNQNNQAARNEYLSKLNAYQPDMYTVRAPSTVKYSFKFVSSGKTLSFTTSSIPKEFYDSMKQAASLDAVSLGSFLQEYMEKTGNMNTSSENFDYDFAVEANKYLTGNEYLKNFTQHILEGLQAELSQARVEVDKAQQKVEAAKKSVLLKNKRIATAEEEMEIAMQRKNELEGKIASIS